MKPHEKLGVAIADAGYAWTPEMRSAWEELDRQQDRIAELEKQSWTEKDLKNACRNARLSENDFLRIKAYLPVYITPQTKPLSDEEIDEILESLDVYIDTHAGVKLFARAIEERHGIK